MRDIDQGHARRIFNLIEDFERPIAGYRYHAIRSYTGGHGSAQISAAKRCIEGARGWRIWLAERGVFRLPA